MATNHHKITILLPIFKPNIKFLKETLRSILDQTLEKKFFKLIIINDTKDDELKDLIDKILKKNINYIYINVDRGNIAKSLQLGLSLVETKYFARIDSDDIMENNRLETQINYMEANDKLSVLGTGVTFIDSNSLEIKFMSSKIYLPSNELIFLIYASFYNNPICHSSVICRTSHIKDIGGYFRNPPAEDYWLWSEVIKTKKILNIDTPLTRYRIHSLQLSKNDPLSYQSRIFIRLRFLKALFFYSYFGTFIALIFFPLVFIPLKVNQKIFKSSFGVINTILKKVKI